LSAYNHTINNQTRYSLVEYWKKERTKWQKKRLRR
jgi:hypothetical protein